MKKKILYIDMDNVLVDFKSGIEKLSDELKLEFEGHYDDTPGIFSLMEPMPGAIDAVNTLALHFDMYVLSTAPWKNPTAWIDKVKWIQQYFGKEKDSVFYKRLIISHHKNLNIGDYLVDDRDKNGADGFQGELIRFNPKNNTEWTRIKEYLLERT